MIAALSHCVVDLGLGQVRSHDGRVIGLSGRESELLRLLVDAAPAAAPRQALIERCAGERALEAAMRRLRRKLERDPRRPDHLLTSFGAGYRLVGARIAEPEAMPPIAGPRTRLVGRSADLERLAAAIARERCVRLTGPPGVGKTALAQAALAGRPGVFVDLSAATSATAALARALGVPAGGLPVRLAVAPAGWIVLDGADPFVDELARALPRWLDGGQLRLLATSRQAIGPPNALPGIEHPVAPLGAEAAEALFWERAGDVRPGLAVDPDARRLVARLLAELDGLPLAIELAAGRLSALPLARVQAEGMGGLQAAIASSWDLLSPEHRRALARLSLFRSEIDPDDVDALLGEGGAGIVGALEQRSLLQPVAGGRTRMLGPIRDWAHRQLGLDPREHDDAARAYVARMADVVRAEGTVVDDHLTSVRARLTDRASALELSRRLPAPEHVARLTWAVEWSLEDELAPKQARLSLLRDALAVEGLPVEHRIRLQNRLGQVLDGEEGVAIAERAAAEARRSELGSLEARALATAGDLRLGLGDLDGAVADLAAARDVADRVGSPSIRLASALAEVHCRRGEVRQGRTLLVAALPASRREGDRSIEAYLLLQIAVAEQALGRYVAAARAREEAAAVARLRGHPLARFNAACADGTRARELGRLDEARHAYLLALSLACDSGQRRPVAHTEGNLALVDELAGDVDRAEDRLGRVSEALAGIGDAAHLSSSLAIRGRLALDRGALDEAVRLLDDARRALPPSGDVQVRLLVEGLGAELAARVGDLAAAAERLGCARALLGGAGELVDAAVRLDAHAGIVARLAGDREAAEAIHARLAGTSELDHARSTAAAVARLGRMLGHPVPR